MNPCYAFINIVIIITRHIIPKRIKKIKQFKYKLDIIYFMKQVVLFENRTSITSTTTMTA